MPLHAWDDSFCFRRKSYEKAVYILYVKEHSPFPVTFIITGNNGYIPSKEAFAYRCYEADTGLYAEGTAEKLAENYVKMLQALQ